jgi:hypothetical protein
MNKCDKCPSFKNQFGNFVMCIETSRFINWEYWNNIEPEDCPLKENKSAPDNMEEKNE